MKKERNILIASIVCMFVFFIIALVDLERKNGQSFEDMTEAGQISSIMFMLLFIVTFVYPFIRWIFNKFIKPLLQRVL